MIKQARLLFSLLWVLAVVMNSAGGVTPSQGMSHFPRGTYTAGDYTMVFGNKGQFRVSKREELQVEGEYTVNGDQVTLIDKRGPFACTTAGQQTGKYRWKYEAEMLTFTVLDDKCEGRSADLPAQPWKHKK